MTLSITNQGVEQVTAPPVDSSTSTSTSTRPPLTNARRQVASSVDAVINTKINPESLTFRWTSVNFTSGTYQFRASIASQNFVSRSTSFNIRQGPDTSCLQSSSTATTTTGIPSNTAINAPVSTTSKSRNIGTIVGVVLGVLALFIVVILGYLRIRGKGKKRFGFSKDVARKWNGLSSVDSRNALAAHVNDEEPRLAAAKRRNYSRGSSVGTVVASHSKEVIGGGTSEEKVGSSNYSRKNSIASYDSSHVMALSTLPTLHHRDRDDVYNPRHHDPYPPASGAAVGRRTSVDRKSARSRSQPYLDPIESDNTVSRSSSVGGTSFTHTGPSDFYASSSPPHPSSPTPPLSAEAKRANRQSFGRKRKPVPAYDPNSEIPSVPSPTPQSPVPMDYEYGHDVRSSPSHQSHATTPDMITYSPAQTSTTLGHYTTRNAAAAAAEDGSETLGHKSSFGPAGVEGKPLHYLMPDLPMSEQTGSISSHSQR
ncbi:hypothetical protein MD484_g4555, partial [Candolleomyces efflorescens]